RDIAHARGVPPGIGATRTFGGAGSSGGGSPMEIVTKSDDERQESSSQAQDRALDPQPITGGSSSTTGTGGDVVPVVGGRVTFGGVEYELPRSWQGVKQVRAYSDSGPAGPAVIFSEVDGDPRQRRHLGMSVPPTGTTGGGTALLDRTFYYRRFPEYGWTTMATNKNWLSLNGVRLSVRYLA